jgi:hypothetical protein
LPNEFWRVEKKLRNRGKSTAIIALILLLSILATISPYISFVKAQSQATVNVSDVIGGSVDPSAGTHQYSDGTAVALTATPDAVNGFQFANWVISTDVSNDTETSNPFTLNVVGGVTYAVSAVFFKPIVEPIIPSTNVTYAVADAVVVILHGVGGYTSPPEGTYYLTGGARALQLLAIPNSGWEFSHWAISGNPLTGHGGSPLTLTPADNPYKVDHGFGYTFAYQPVFFPVGSSNPLPAGTTTGGLSTETIIIIVLVVVIVIMVAVIGAYSYPKRSKN